jgi:hypothetical protein
LVEEGTVAPIFNSINYSILFPLGVKTNYQYEGTKITYLKNKLVQSVTHLPILSQTLGYQHGLSNDASTVPDDGPKYKVPSNQISVTSQSVANTATCLPTCSTIVWDGLSVHKVRMCNNCGLWTESESESEVDNVLPCDMRKWKMVEYQNSKFDHCFPSNISGKISTKPILPAKTSSRPMLRGSNESMTFMDGLPIIYQLQEKASGDLIKQGAALSIKQVYNAPDDTCLSVQLQQQDQQDLWATSRTMAKILPILFLMTIICNEAPSSTGNMVRSSSVMPTSDSMVKPASRDTSEYGW